MKLPRIFTAAFWVYAGERAIKTAAQAAAATLGAGMFNIADVDLTAVIGISAGAALLSILTSIGGQPK